jgi:excisionase family DNA binding protein
MPLTLAQAAESLGITHDTLRRQVRLGVLAAVKLGPVWTVSEESIERYRTERLGRIGRPRKVPLTAH